MDIVEAVLGVLCTWKQATNVSQVTVSHILNRLHVPHLTESGLQLRKCISGLLQLSISQHRQGREEALLLVDLLELKWGCCHLCQTVSPIL